VFLNIDNLDKGSKPRQVFQNVQKKLFGVVGLQPETVTTVRSAEDPVALVTLLVL